MEELPEGKPQKYSLITGEKIKTKSVKKLKKEHKFKDKQDEKEQKKTLKRKKKIDKKLTNSVVVQSKTISNSDLEEEQDRERLNKEALEEIKNEQQASLQTNQEKVLIVRKTEKGKPVSLKRKLLNLLSYALVGIVAVFFGYFTGNFYVANVLNKVDYSAYSEEGLRDDGSLIYSQIVSSGRTPDRCSAIELFVASEYLMNQQENYKVSSKGEVSPSIGSTQTVWGYKNKTGNIFEIESVSKGMLSVGETYVYDTTTKLANIYKASKISNDTAEYPSEPTSVLTYEEFREEYGSAPDVPCIPYIISSKTVIEGSESVTSLGSGRYQISFALSNTSSVINYVKQVKHMSGLSNYPTFRSIVITAVIDADLKFSYIRYDESYTVMYFGVMASCEGWLENRITY